MTYISQCPHRVPPTLWVLIIAPPRCRLVGPGGIHHGDHRATFKLANVGKAAFVWKGIKHRPTVQLPSPTADHIQPARGKVI